jgi:hypothetical protein
MSHCGWFPLNRNEIHAWVERHRDELPTTLAELARFPMRFRTDIVNSAEPQRRIAFWTEHLQSFLGPQSEFSAAQQEFIAATLLELPALLSTRGPKPALSDWEARASKVFTRMEAGRLFAMIGPPEPPGGLPLPPDALPQSPSRTDG